MISAIYPLKVQQRRGFIENYLRVAGIQFWEQSFSTESYNGLNIVADRWIRNDGPNVLVSAHYDGWGAYDNAGGTAALLWVARWIGPDDLRLKGSQAGMIAVFLDGEEHGLLGAEAFALEYLCRKKPRIVGQISLDGFGIGTQMGCFANTREILLRNEYNRVVNLVLQADTTVFQRYGLPSLHLFSLPHDELSALVGRSMFPRTWNLLHTKEDTPEKTDEQYLPFQAMHLCGSIRTLDFGAQGIMKIGGNDESDCRGEKGFPGACGLRCSFGVSQTIEESAGEGIRD